MLFEKPLIQYHLPTPLQSVSTQPNTQNQQCLTIFNHLITIFIHSTNFLLIDEVGKILLIGLYRLHNLLPYLAMSFLPKSNLICHRSKQTIPIPHNRLSHYTMTSHILFDFCRVATRGASPCPSSRATVSELYSSRGLFSSWLC